MDSRLGFIGLDDARIDHIRKIKPLIMQALPAALDSFYSKVASEPETRRFFSGKPAMDSAKSRQLNHWDRISSGLFDNGYVDAVTTVGEVHARIGLEPRWYIGGYAMLLSSLIAAVVEARWPKGGLGLRKAPGAAALSAELGALVRATLLDMDYAISVYLEAAEAQRKATEAAVLAQERSVVVERVGEGMEALAAGDLSFRMSSDIPHEYAKLRDDFNAAMDGLQQAMRTVAQGSQAIQSGTQEIAQASDDLSRRTEQQAASLEETAAAL
ncbi:MAG: globin-coupled sensor protein, partial [Proteobacteria bacterium]|nr:globin-coupled sensor protein [Pseudomonadota bacterium]